MADVDSNTRLATAVAWSGRAAVVAVFIVSLLDWVGWATGNHRLTQISTAWTPMMPWSAVLMSVLAAATMMQWGEPTRTRVWVGRAVAVTVGVLAGVFLAQYLTGASLRLDQLFFSEAVRMLPDTWPGRPSPRTAASALLLAIAVVLTRLDHRWIRVAWPLLLATAVAEPVVAVAAYLFEAVSMPEITGSTAISISAAMALILLTVGIFAARPDRNPVAWLLARPDGWTLVRMVGIIVGLPILVGLSRLAFLAAGLREDAAWVLSVMAGTAVVGGAALYFGQREQQILLLERATLRAERAEAQTRFRMIAENAVDIVVHLRGGQVAWVSPSVQPGLGESAEQWIDSDFGQRVHPDDLDEVLAKWSPSDLVESARARFRVRAAGGEYHWVDGHAKLYIDDDGKTDGVIAALRIVDDQVEAERQLERLARFDALTGLLSRAETISRFNAALEFPRSPGGRLGVLFCDIDHFKDINDTWGHPTGDAALTTIAARIRDTVRQGDIVGRMGGDEMMILLAGVHDLDEVVRIAEKIRCRAAEPIHYAGNTIHTTVSIGATIADPGDSGNQLLARADVAMYQAKDAGRNTVVRIEPTEGGAPQTQVTRVQG